MVRTGTWPAPARRRCGTSSFRRGLRPGDFGEIGTCQAEDRCRPLDLGHVQQFDVTTGLDDVAERDPSGGEFFLENLYMTLTHVLPRFGRQALDLKLVARPGHHEDPLGEPTSPQLGDDLRPEGIKDGSNWRSRARGPRPPPGPRPAALLDESAGWRCRKENSDDPTRRCTETLP